MTMAQRHLAQSLRHVREQETRIAAQMVRIQELGRDGGDTTRARDFLYQLEDFMTRLKAHRDMVQREVDEE